MFEVGLTCMYTLDPSVLEHIGEYSPIAAGWALFPRHFELNSKLLEHEQSSILADSLGDNIVEPERVFMLQASPNMSVVMIGNFNSPHVTFNEQSSFLSPCKYTYISKSY